MSYDYLAGDGYRASIVEAVFAAGMLLGATVIMVWGGVRSLALLVSVASVVSGLLCAAAGLTPPTMFGVFGVLCGLLGAVCAGFNGPMVTLVQRNVSEELMGRVMGFITMMMGLTTPLGIAVGGVVAQAIGVAPFFLVDGLLFAALGVCLYLPRSVRALDAAA